MNGVPQPWEAEGMAQDEFIEFAKTLEAKGNRLVVRYLYDAYPDNDPFLWCVGSTVLVDWRTGEHVASFTYEEDDDSLYEGVVIMENHLAESS